LLAGASKVSLPLGVIGFLFSEALLHDAITAARIINPFIIDVFFMWLI